MDILLTCSTPTCQKQFYRNQSEHNRNLRKNRKVYCSLSCKMSYENKVCPRNRITAHLNSANRRDEFSPFRWFFARIKTRVKENPSKQGDIDLQYLKDLWEKQEGRCPLTGWKLILPTGMSIACWEKSAEEHRASLDRIDSSKGYVRGNVRFISFMANMAKNKLKEQQLLSFCEAVARNQNNLDVDYSI